MDDVKEYYNQVVSGKMPGFSSGFRDLDRLIGRLDGGQVIAVGGYNGTGKSYFLLNLVDRIQNLYQEKDVVLYSAEMTVRQYQIRRTMMHAGLYKNMFEEEPQKYKDRVWQSVKQMYVENAMKPFEIVGDVYTYEQIEKDSIKRKPSILAVDFLQQLAIDGKYSNEDTMKLLPARFAMLAKKLNCVVILVSQVTLASNREGVSGTSPWDYGKHLNHIIHAGIHLTREKDKDTGKRSKLLALNVTKARDGEEGKALLEICDGFMLKDLPDYKIDNVAYNTKIEQLLNS